MLDVEDGKQAAELEVKFCFQIFIVFFVFCNGRVLVAGTLQELPPYACPGDTFQIRENKKEGEKSAR